MKQVSRERQAVYTVGLVLMVLGGILFASTFLTFALRMGDVSGFASSARSGIFRALAGMALLIVGAILRGVGARGLAGSGVVLDPEQARQDLEPYSRMAGGMVRDALDEAQVDLGGPEKVVMVKCPSCGKLNEEDSKFCQECGQKL